MGVLAIIWQKIKRGGWWVGYYALYYACWVVGRVLARWVSYPVVEGVDNIPHEGALLYTANHLSSWDIIFMHNLLRRPGYWVTKKEYFEIPFMGGLVRLFGAFPISRGKYDREALKRSIDYLNQGEILVIFPEGTRSRDAQLARGMSGAALIALKTNALIVPIGFSGTEKIGNKADKSAGRKIKPAVRVRIGKPYRLPHSESGGKRANLDEMSDLIMLKIAEQLPPVYQGVYAAQLATATAD